jgi:hypothetical protein
MEVGAAAGFQDLEAIRDRLNRWRLLAHGQNQARHTGLAALRAPQLLVPILNHAPHCPIKSLGTWRRFQAKLFTPVGCQLPISRSLFLQVGFELWIIFKAGQPLELESVLQILSNHFQR